MSLSDERMAMRCTRYQLRYVTMNATRLAISLLHYIELRSRRFGFTFPFCLFRRRSWRPPGARRAARPPSLDGIASPAGARRRRRAPPPEGGTRRRPRPPLSARPRSTRARAPRTRPTPLIPTEQERRQHCLTHFPFRDWCKPCVFGRGKDDPHAATARVEADDALPKVQIDFCFMELSLIHI